MFDDVEQGNSPRVKFFVNQRPYDMAYYLADGIYPSYPTFVKSIRLPQSEPDKLFAKYQEGCQKDIETRIWSFTGSIQNHSLTSSHVGYIRFSYHHAVMYHIA